MHPMDTDLVARSRREDARRSAEQWRALRAGWTRPPLQARVGARLVTIGLHLQAAPARRRAMRGRVA